MMMYCLLVDSRKIHVVELIMWKQTYLENNNGIYLFTVNLADPRFLFLNPYQYTIDVQM